MLLQLLPLVWKNKNLLRGRKSPRRQITNVRDVWDHLAYTIRQWGSYLAWTKEDDDDDNNDDDDDDDEGDDPGRSLGPSVGISRGI